jgi:hypothetical protein
VKAVDALASYAYAFATEMVPSTLFADRAAVLTGRIVVMLCVDVAYSDGAMYVELHPIDRLLDMSPSSLWGRACRSFLLLAPRAIVEKGRSAAQRSFNYLAVNVAIRPPDAFSIAV